MSGSLSRRELLRVSALIAPSVSLGGVGCRSSVPEERGRPLARAPNARAVVAAIEAEPTLEGAGVHLSRSIGSRRLSWIDPFLLLDDIHSSVPDEYVRGFPTHPHRGFETVTYMIEGTIEHRDSVGNRGLLTPGSVQWMTAGRGIVHSEMPHQASGPLWGLQLWVNLPRAEKLRAPRYQDIAAPRVPELEIQGARTRVVAGSAGGERGPVEGIAVDPTLLDLSLPTRGRVEHEFAPEQTVIAYVLDGAVELGAERTPLRAGTLAVFGPGRTVVAQGAPRARLLVVSGKPWNEPMARRGPFVMNTEAELDQAYADFRSGRLIQG